VGKERKFLKISALVRAARLDKGISVHIFNVSVKPKNWGSLADFKACACLGVIGEIVNYYLDCDFKILTFK